VIFYYFKNDVHRYIVYNK